MYRLFYVSHAHEGTTEEQVDELAEQAASNNLELGIVGALCFNGSAFAQVLEGPQDSVNQLVDKIRKDYRHSGMIIIAEKPVRFRIFKEFNMKRVRGMDFSELINAMAAD